MNILVLGNGFDLAHELPTRYKDFLSFIQIIQNNLDERQLSPAFVIAYFKEFLRKKQLLESETIDENFDNIEISSYIKSLADFSNTSKANFWMQHFFYRQNEMGGRWVDFEQEISDCVKKIEATSYNIPVNFDNTLEETREYILTMENRDAIKKLEKDLMDLNKSLELYMLLVNKLECSILLSFNKIPEPQYVINFNYTNTCFEYWSETIQDTDFVHGEVGYKNVILGAGETLVGDEINTELSCVRFKKYFQRIHNRTGGKYRQWLKDEEQKNINRTPKMNDIIIYGHSLDITDKDILSYIILHELTAKVTIYYYEDNTKSDYETSIINLIQVIGKEELTARVGDGRIEFISTKDLGGKSYKAIV